MASCPAQPNDTECKNAIQPRNGEICQVCNAPRMEKECAYQRKVRVTFARGNPELDAALDKLTDQLDGIYAFYEQIKIDCTLDTPWLFGSCASRSTLANFVREFLDCSKTCRSLNFELKDPNLNTENKLKRIEDASAKLAKVTDAWRKIQWDIPPSIPDFSKITL